jgi:hypothetical protein
VVLSAEEVASGYLSGSYFSMPHIKTRGDVRRLCRALGVELKEDVS